MRVTLHLVVTELIALIGLTLYIAEQVVLGWEVDLTRWVHSWSWRLGVTLDMPD